MPKLMPEERAKLFAEAQRGKRTESFLLTEFWRKDLGPHLKQYQQGLGHGALWHPGNLTDLGAVGLGCAFNGGRSQSVDDFLTELNIWVEKGRESQAKLNKDEGLPPQEGA